jgi:hypothetical protein
MAETDSSSPDESGPIARSGPSVRVAETDLAILTAFCRPYLDGDQRFAVPAPNNEILRELAQNGIYLDLDTLRGHLRVLYAKFGVEDGLNPAQKRARLAELVHENSVISGWEPQPEQAPQISPTPPAAAATPSPVPSAFRSAAPTLPQPPRASRWRRFLHDRWWIAAGIAVALLAAVIVLTNLGGFARTPPRARPPASPATEPDRSTVAAKSTCQPDKFCLARRANMSGGLYQSTRSDSNFTDDTFYRFTDPAQNEQLLPRVSGHTWSAWNRGDRDVIVYDGAAFTGAGACIHAGRPINLPANWQDRISSFRFATRSVCDRYEELADANE